jgi:branched-chain amino acid transport system substrate-binding protein
MAAEYQSSEDAMIRLSLVSALMAGAVVTSSPANAEVLVGVPDVFSGPAGWGHNVLRAVELAAAKVNEAGGVLGEPVRVTWVDDACDADQAIFAAHKMVAAGAVFVMGHTCSHAAIAASKVYEEAGVLYMTAYATDPRLTEQGRRNVFRLRGRNDQIAALAAGYLSEHWGDKRIAIVHDGRIYGQLLAETVRQRLNERGVREIFFDEVAPGQLDFSALVGKLRSAGIDVMFMGGYPFEAGLLKRQAHAAGVEFLLVGGGALHDEEFGLTAGEAAEGTLTFDAPIRDKEAAARARAAYKERYPEQPGNPGQDWHYLSYVAFNVWAEAVERAGSLDLDVVSRVLHGQRFDTIIGVIWFDEKGDLAGIEPWRWSVWKHGELLPIDADELPTKD